MICDQRPVDMDEEELVSIIEKPDGSMLDTPVACNGGAGPAESVLMQKAPSQHLLPIAL
jgi:hypothetical protein